MMRSACSTVDSRCAMMKVVRLRTSCASAAWMWRSASVSSAEVASSRMRMGASFSSARAMAMRWRCPPESSTPRSPTIVSRPPGWLRDELQHVGGLGGPLDRRIRHVAAEGDVVADGVVEQHDVLAHHRDLLAQALQVVLAHVAPVDAHACRATTS